jgi:hypothetical protein
VKGPEVHGVGVLDDRDQETAAAVPPLGVDRQAQVDAPGVEAMRLAVALHRGVDHRGELLHRQDDGPADEVGE